eukprot:350708-Chlamydomonas_euryale.AAC.11
MVTCSLVSPSIEGRHALVVRLRNSRGVAKTPRFLRALPHLSCHSLHAIGAHPRETAAPPRLLTTDTRWRARRCHSAGDVAFSAPYQTLRTASRPACPIETRLPGRPGVLFLQYDTRSPSCVAKTAAPFSGRAVCTAVARRRHPPRACGPPCHRGVAPGVGRTRGAVADTSTDGRRRARRASATER